VTAAERVIRWPTTLAVVGVEAVAAVVSCEHGAPGTEHDTDPLRERAAELFAGQLAADRVPPVHAIRAQFHAGQPRAQRLRDCLARELQGGRKVPQREQLAGQASIATAAVIALTAAGAVNVLAAAG
jgi:hypothetical protein